MGYRALATMTLVCLHAHSPNAQADNVFSADLALYGVEPLNTEADPRAFVEAGLSYRFTGPLARPLVTSVAIDFTHTFTTYEDENRNAAFGDLSLSLSYPELINDKDRGWISSLTLSAILPTSRTSRLASLRAGGALSWNLTKDLKILSLSTTQSVYGYAYEYETADQDGSTYNEITAFWSALRVGIPIIGTLSTRVTGGLYTLYNYAGNWNQHYEISTGISYAFSKNLSADSFFKAKDEIVTNNSLFDHDNTSVGLGLVVNL